MAWAFHDVRLERDRLIQRLQPAFEMVDDDPACYQQESGKYELCRVVIKNSGGTSVAGVKVRLVNVRTLDGSPLDEQELLPRLPLPLVPQHRKNSTPSATFSLDPGEKQPVDVVTMATGNANLVIVHSVGDHRNGLAVKWIDDSSYLLDLQVFGTDVPPVTRTARVFTGADHRLSLVLVP
jgi:hypothetical protein